MKKLVINEISVEKLSEVLNFIIDTTQNDRDLARKEFTRVSDHLNKMWPDMSSAERLISIESFYKPMRAFLASLSNNNDALLKLAKIMSDRLRDEAGNIDDDTLTDEEKTNLQKDIMDAL